MSTRLAALDKNSRPDASLNPASDDGTGTPAIWIKAAPPICFAIESGQTWNSPAASAATAMI